MFVFMGSALRVAEGEIAHGDNQRVHPHSGEVVAKALPFALVPGKDERLAMLVGAERVDKGRLVHAG